MNRVSRTIVWRTIVLLAALSVLFFVVQDRFRTLEASVCADVASWIAPHRAMQVQGPYILVVPYHSPAFLAFVTPSCSSLAPMLALLALSTILPPHAGVRRYLAAGAAMAMVFLGNVLRISASLLAGVISGRASLVLFHNWVGSAFTFAYILGGFMLMIALMLPSPRRQREIRDALTS